MKDQGRSYLLRALETMGAEGREAAKPLLVELLSDPSEFKRHQGVQILARHDLVDPWDLVSTYDGLLGSKNPWFRLEAAEWLLDQRQESDDRLEIVLRPLLEHDYERIRERAAIALQKLGS